MAEKEYISYDEIVEECKKLAERIKNNNFNKIMSHFSTNYTKDIMTVFKVYSKHCIREGLCNYTLHCNTINFCHFKLYFFFLLHNYHPHSGIFQPMTLV